MLRGCEGYVIQKERQMPVGVNLNALSAQLSVDKYRKQNAETLSKLSSGTKSSVIKDAISDVVIGTKLDSNIVQQKQALANASKARSLLEIVDSSYSTINQILQKQTVLATKASSSTVSDTGRILLNEEFQSLNSAINQTIGQTKFNNLDLFDERIVVNTKKAPKGVEVISSDSQGVFQIKYNRKAEKFIARLDGVKYGAYDITKDKGQGEINFSIKNLDLKVNEDEFNLKKSFGFKAFEVEAIKKKYKDFDFAISQSSNENSRVKARVNKSDTEYLGLDKVNLKTQESAEAALDTVKGAFEKLQYSRADVGSVISRLDFASSYANVAIENATAAKQGLLGVDLSQEVVKFVTNQYVLQSGVFLVAQANQRNGDILDLVKG
jgi:flagellin